MSQRALEYILHLSHWAEAEIKDNCLFGLNSDQEQRIGNYWNPR